MAGHQSRQGSSLSSIRVSVAGSAAGRCGIPRAPASIRLSRNALHGQPGRRPPGQEPDQPLTVIDTEFASDHAIKVVTLILSTTGSSITGPAETVPGTSPWHRLASAPAGTTAQPRREISRRGGISGLAGMTEDGRVTSGWTQYPAPMPARSQGGQVIAAHCCRPGGISAGRRSAGTRIREHPAAVRCDVGSRDPPGPDPSGPDSASTPLASPSGPEPAARCRPSLVL